MLTENLEQRDFKGTGFQRDGKGGILISPEFTSLSRSKYIRNTSKMLKKI